MTSDLPPGLQFGEVSNAAIAEDLHEQVSAALDYTLGVEVGLILPQTHEAAVRLVERTQLEHSGEVNPWLAIDPSTMASILGDFLARGTSLTDCEAVAIELTEEEAQRLYHFAVMVTKVKKYRDLVAPGSEGDL